MFNTIKSCGRIFKSAYKVTKEQGNVNDYILSLPTIKSIDVKDYNVSVNIKMDNDAIMASGIRFGMAHFFVKNNKAHYTILLENNTFKIGGSDLCQFIIYHELGHFVNEVFGKYFICNTRTLANEMNADLYAVKNIGAERTLKALTTLYNQKGISKSEIRKRIQNIELYMLANPNK